MYASEYSYLWLVQAQEKEMTIQLERRRVTLERQQEAREQEGAVVRETWRGRMLRPIRGRSRRLVAAHPAPHD
jgi:hypothetical protein